MLTIFAILFMLIMYAVIGYVRGRGKLDGKMSKFISCMGWAYCTGFAAAVMGYSEDAINEIMLVTFFGLLFWIVRGWGLYQSAYTGIWAKGEKEIVFIDKIGMSLVPYVSPVDIEGNRERGLICMALRGGVFMLPCFAAFAYYVSPWAMFFWPFTFLKGFIYYFNEPYAEMGNTIPEPVTAALFALLIGLTLSVGI